MVDAVLKVSGLSCARGGLTVLDGVEFQVGAGEAIVLRGPNGSGKTTLLRTIAGLQAADTGVIEIAPDSIAYAGHADGIKGTLTVAENLTFWAGMFGMSGVMAALEGFDLVDLAERPAQALSAGQKRRLGLARLLVTGRPVWALDEPTVSLDVHAVALFGAVLERHLAGGGCALIATHIDLGIAAREIDISSFKARGARRGTFDEAFT
ncbi:MAG: heme ABC exporter ATP-binding protein CcmA [Boseongicola sp.]|nr:MAG: heme ABC exporter ATP-binding protein CcmA [Boseongicola sp.]